MLWLITLILLAGVLAYHKATIHWATLAITAVLAAYLFNNGLGSTNLSIWMTFLIVFIPLNVIPLRQKLISSWVLKLMKAALPPMSKTEKEALEAGNTWWDAELFSGSPNWSVLQNLPPAKFSKEEQSLPGRPHGNLMRHAQRLGHHP